MCNFIHAKYTVPRKTQGTGYKLFTLNPETNILSSLIKLTPYTVDISKYIKWSENKPEEGEGFCFFYNLKEARRTYNISRLKLRGKPNQHIALIKIRYYKAIARQIEKGFFPECEVDMGLCKKFEILETLCHDTRNTLPAVLEALSRSTRSNYHNYLIRNEENNERIRW